MKSYWQYLLIFPLVIGIIGVVHFTERTMTTQLFAFYGIAFSAYVLLFKQFNPNHSLPFWIGIGVLLRVVMVFAMPNLSDDVFRFVWDGRLIMNGYNPYLELPGYYLENNIVIEGINENLYNQLNSKAYFTIYPTVLQSIFALSVWLSPNDILGSVIVMKTILILCEIGTIYLLFQLLKKFQLPIKNILLYALNPLIIVELVGNIHFEAVMIFFVILAIWLLVKGKHHLSAISIAFAVATKLLPLMFLPFLFRRLGWRKSLVYYSITGITVIVLFLPLLNMTFINNIGESIDLYFRKFEYNGSLFYIMRWIGYQATGFDMVQVYGPILSKFAAIFIITKAVLVQERGFQKLPLDFLFAMSLYLLTATTVHPWYLGSLLAFSTLTNYRYTFVWSLFIFLTYINYSYTPFWENLWIVALEYIVVFGWLFWEIRLDIMKLGKGIKDWFWKIVNQPLF